MMITRLELKGLTCLSHVSLDLDALPSGLIAITGENGAGKSTLMSAMIAALYRSLPDRDGELVDYATQRDAFIETEVACEDERRYRLRVNLDGIARKSDAVLMDGAGRYLNNCQVTTYDTAIAQIFPTKDTMLSAQFAAQNKRGSFATLKPKEKKDLFSALIGLGAYDAMTQTVKTILDLIEQSRGRLRVRQDEVAKQAVGADALTDQARQLQIEMGDTETEYAHLRDEQAQSERLLAALADQVAAYRAAYERVTSLQWVSARQQQTRADLASQRRAAEAAHQREVADLQRRHEVAVEGAAAKRAAVVKECESKIQGNRTLLAQQDQVRGACWQIAAIDARLTAIGQTIHQTATSVQALVERRDALRVRLSNLALAEGRLTAATRGAALINHVPFGTKCADASCQFLSDAIAAKGQIEPLTLALTDRPRLTDDVAELTAQLNDAQTTLATLNGERASLTAERDTVAPVAKYADAIGPAQARIDGYEETKRQADVDAQEAIAAATANWHQDVNASGHRFGTVNDDLVARERAADDASLALAMDLDAAQQALGDGLSARQEADRLESSLREARAAWDRLTARRAAQEAQLATIETRRQGVVQAQGRLARLHAKATQLETECVEWQLLHRALGPNGLPILEIDAAGPMISQILNALLVTCFGTRFSGELVTQQAKAGGKGVKEHFDLVVTDNQRGQVVSISDLSGGEQVIVNEALMNSIGLYVNQRSAMPIRTAWRDETTGALDPENAERYLQMLRKVHQIGEYDKIYFITHNPVIVAQADAEIHVANGTAVIRLPPFAAAA